MRLLRVGVKRRKPDRQGNNCLTNLVNTHNHLLREESLIDRTVFWIRKSKQGGCYFVKEGNRISYGSR